MSKNKRANPNQVLQSTQRQQMLTLHIITTYMYIILYNSMYTIHGTEYVQGPIINKSMQLILKIQHDTISRILNFITGYL